MVGQNLNHAAGSNHPYATQCLNCHKSNDTRLQHKGFWRQWEAFDCPDLEPRALAVTFGRVLAAAEESEPAPPLLLEMYNHTGSGTTGTHYDPVFPATPGAHVAAAGNASLHTPPTTTC